MLDDKWRIGFVSNKGKKMSKLLDVPNNHKNSTLIWSEDDQSIFFIGADGGVGNIGKLDLSNNETKQITNFTSQAVSDFAIDSEGKRLAITRSRSFNDVRMKKNNLFETSFLCIFSSYVKINL